MTVKIQINRIISLYLKRGKHSFNSRRKRTYTSFRQKIKIIYLKIISYNSPEAIIWIFGCQRSGSTLLERMFRHDLRSVVFGEFSLLTISPDKTVLSPLEEVKEKISKQKAKYAVIRPLFESNRAQEILENIPSSSAVWLFRDYKYVVNSMLNKWGFRFFEVSRKNESDKHGFWRLEKTITEIEKTNNASRSIADYYAMYWYERNCIFFSGNLEFQKILCLNYVQLVNNPSYCVDTIMKYSGNSIWSDFSTDANTKSIERQLSTHISTDIAFLCDNLYEKLNKISIKHFPDA
ncbi:MAG: hypothetical protein ACJASM_003214 [Salibacteraceae bacterium]